MAAPPGTSESLDPYAILGIAKDADAATIRKAYRRLAKKNHPDLHPGDRAAEARFKDVAAANAILGDAAKRAKYDAGEIDAAGHARSDPQPDRRSYREQAEATAGAWYDAGWDRFEGADGDLFADLFRARTTRQPARGADVHYTLSVAFLDAINGATKRVEMGDGRRLDVVIKPGLDDGQTLRLRGQGRPGADDASPGDALVEIHIVPHADFTRVGRDIRTTLAVTIGEALAGAKIPVPTVSGSVTMTVPRGSSSGTVLRLRGRGVPSADGPGTGAGDQFVEIRIVVPSAPDAALVDAVTAWELAHSYDPRGGKGR